MAFSVVNKLPLELADQLYFLQESLPLQREEKAEGTKGAGNRGEGRASLEARFSVGKMQKNGRASKLASDLLLFNGVGNTLGRTLCNA
jgi:hypothetical protein